MSTVEVAKDMDPLVDEAISVWEKGVLKEKNGSMSDAINYYRKAIKLHEGVEKIYRKKLHEEWELHQKMKSLGINVEDDNDESKTQGDDTEATDTERELLPCWILDMLPDDILLKVIEQVVIQSGESWLNISLTCSRFNALCFKERLPYETFKDIIYPRQQYDEQSMTLNGINNLQVLEKELWGDDCVNMLKTRPYIKFEGLYISVVNYLRYGTNAEGSSSLLNPVHMITYYRYFRFYEDGKVLRLLTTDEPSHVVGRFSRESKPKNSELCRWSIGFEENFGCVSITRHTQKYAFKETLAIKKQGNKGFQRLKWVASTVEDNEGNISECSLRNEKTFFFSRVRSYAKT